MIIASDFDGTIYIDFAISDKDKEAIRDFQEAGNLFAIVTGRSYHSLAPLIEGKIDPDIIIANNGGHILIKKDRTYEEIFKAKIDKDLARGFINYYKDTYEVTIFTEDKKLYDLDKVKGDIMALAIYTDDMVENHFKDDFDFHYSIGVTDVVKAGVDKARGIEIIKDYYAYKDDVIAIGDDYNDIVFLEKTPQSYTLDYVENPHVRDAVNYSVSSLGDLIRNILND